MALLDGNATHPGLTSSGIPVISAQATSPMLSDKAKYPRFMRVCSSLALSSLAMVQMFSKYGITRIAGIGNDDSYGQGGLQKLVTYAARATPPIEIASVVYFPVASTNPHGFYHSYLEQIRAAKPEAIVVYCASLTCLPMLEEARLMGMLQKPYAWILGNGLTTYPTLSSIAQLYPQLAEAIANNTIVMAVSTAVDWTSVTERYTAGLFKYMKEDRLLSPFYSLFEYDAGLAWVLTMKKIIAAGQDPHNGSLFYSTLISLEYQGATGHVSFDENGDRYAKNTIFRWVQGEDNLAAIGNWTVGNGVVIDPSHAPWAQWRGTEVAAKVIPIRQNEEIDEEKLLQEVSIMKSLRHPNLLLFMCYAKTSEALTIVTEFIQNGSLLDVLADKAMPMSTGLKISILSDIASGMAYLHGSNPPIIHRDLKSSNILLAASMQAKVCDFGLTVIEHKHHSLTTQSDDSVLGSLLWSAPEIINHGTFSTKSDVYAFGVMLWETVTRELPYKNMNPAMVSSYVAEKNCRPEVGPEFEKVHPLRELMGQCWDASPDARPEFSEVLGDLNKASELLSPLIMAEKENSVEKPAPTGWMAIVITAAHEVQQDKEALAQLGKLHCIGPVLLQGIAQPEDLFDFTVAGLERQFPGVHASTVVDVSHDRGTSVHDPDLFERFSKTVAPSWSIAARDVEMTKEVAERGNYGIVFKGVWRSQTVAVKKLLRQKMDSISIAEMEHQIREIAVLSELGACTEPHSMFIVTEWMDMGSLQQLIGSSSQIDRQRGISILASTCSALAFLHQCGIVHRDLKSSNILLGKNMDVKVSDFGMAAAKAANKTSTLCGSIAWMAPEVLSSGAYSEASDAYSFGVVMNEILSCEVPFRGLNKVTVSREILLGRRPDIPKAVGAYTSQYVDLMRRCWDQQPSQRPTFKAIGTELSSL
eukprot:m51a1_g10277 putative serine threonine protein (926) ;mRNA; r:68091-72480